ncbi:MAG: hypothetical protein JWM40_2324 [Frankiales bacterium]|nr:hypothetical protein [Frankiales bacterium]
MTTLRSTATSNQDFTAMIALPARPEVVAELFTSAAGVSRWWGPTEGDASVGGTLATSFGEYGINAMRVLEAGPNRVVWESVALEGVRPTEHVQEWLGTTMEFDMVPSEIGTELQFRHVGLTPQLACWDDCYAGWTHFMASIQQLAETGTGNPHGG